MDKAEAIQFVRDECEQYKAQQNVYPEILYVGGEVWRALVNPGYIFPPYTQPMIVLPLRDSRVSDTHTLGPPMSISIVKVQPK